MKYLLLLSLVFWIDGYGASKHFWADGQNIRTSDGLSFQSYSLHWMKDRQDFIYPYNEEKHPRYNFRLDYTQASATESGSELNAHKLGAGISYLAKDHLLWKLWGGVHQYKNSTGTDEQAVVGEISVEWKKGDFYQFGSVGRDYAYQDLFVPKGIEEDLKSDRLFARSLYTGFPGYRLNNRFTLNKLSDGNKRWQDDIDVKRQFLKNQLWLWLGAGGEYIYTNRDVTGYWTPRRYISFGPRIELGIDLTSLLSLQHGTNFNYFYDENSRTGYGYYTITNLRWGKRDNRNLSLGFERILSRQNSKDWISNQLILRGNFFF